VDVRLDRSEATSVRRISPVSSEESVRKRRSPDGDLEAGTQRNESQVDLNNNGYQRDRRGNWI
jgi:hypothetical protein